MITKSYFSSCPLGDDTSNARCSYRLQKLWDTPGDGDTFKGSGTGFKASFERTIDITPINKGIAVDDSAMGTGFIMYSEEDLFQRFSDNPPYPESALHLIAVRVIDDEWYYSDEEKVSGTEKAK